MDAVDVTVVFWDAVEVINHCGCNDTVDELCQNLRKISEEAGSRPLGVSVDSALPPFVVDELPVRVQLSDDRGMYLFQSFDDMFFGMYEIFYNFSTHEDHRREELSSCVDRMQQRTDIQQLLREIAEMGQGCPRGHAAFETP